MDLNPTQTFALPSTIPFKHAEHPANELTQKLVHPIAEIRARALSSLRFKLHMNILTLSDLVHEKSLIKAVLEWFNFAGALQDETSVQSALGFLLLLSKHPQSKKNLLDMGANHFLRLLRKDLQTTEAQSMADEIVKQLLFLSSETTNHTANQRVQSQPTNANPPNRAIVHYQSLPLKSSRPTSPARAVKMEKTLQERPLTNTISPGSRPFPDMDNIPRIPNSIHIAFEYLQLSASDEEFVNEFHHLMTTQSSRMDLYEKLRWNFDVACYDYGSHLFLQRTHLFTALMNGTGRSSPEAMLFLEMLGKLCDRWMEHFLEVSSLSEPYSNAGPTKSRSYNSNVATYNGSKQPGSNTKTEDMGISLPFAAHEVFCRIVPLIKDPSLALLVIRILDKLKPLIKLYIDSITYQRNYDIEAYSKYASFYVGSLIDNCLYYNDETVSDAMSSMDRLMIRRAIHLLLMDYLCEFGPISKTDGRSSAFWSVVLFILKVMHYPLSATVSKACLDANSNMLGFVDVLIKLLHHHDIDCQLVCLNSIMDTLSTNPSGPNIELLFSILISSLKDDDNNVKMLKLRAVNIMIRSLQEKRAFEAMYRLMQSHFDVDRGNSLTELQSRMRHLIDERFFIESALRGLLHRNEACRKESASLIKSIQKASAYCRVMNQPWNAFVFESAPAVDNPEAASTAVELPLDEVIQRLRTPCDLEISRKLLFQLACYLRDRLTTQKCLELGVIDVLVSFVQQPLTTNSEFMMITWERTLATAFLCLRLAVERNEEEKWSLLHRQDILMLLGIYAFAEDASLRFEVARISCCLLFQNGVIRARDVRSSYFYSKDVMLAAYEERKGESFGSHLILPPLVTDSFFVYSAVEKLIEVRSDVVDLSNDETVFLLAFLRNNRSNGPWDQFVSVKDITVELKNARSHEEFQHSLKRLEWLLPCQNDRGYFDEQTILAIMKKFLFVPPASPKDAEVFIQITNFLSKFLGKEAIRNEISWKLISEAITSNMLRLLDHGNDELKRSSVNHEEVSECVVGFVCHIICKCSPMQLEKLLRCSQLISVIKSLSFRFLSRPPSSATDRSNRKRCLICLNQIACIPSWTSFVKRELALELISLLVHTFGNLQTASSKHSCFEDKYFYHYVGKILHSFSKAFVELPLHGIDKDDFGQCFQINGNIDWLLSQLNNEDVILQNYSISILSNLIMLNDVYRIVIQKFPNILEMALTYVFNPNIHSMTRGEALILANNAISRICNENNNRDESKRYLQENLERFQFFLELNQLLVDVNLFLAAPDSLIKLLCNLAILAGDYVRERFATYQVWPHICTFLKTESELKNILCSSSLKTELESYECFRILQYLRRTGPRILDCHCTLLELIHVLLQNDMNSRKLVVLLSDSSRSLLSLTLDIVDESNSVLQLVDRIRFNKRTSLLFKVTSDLMADFYDNNVNVLVQCLNSTFVSCYLKFIVNMNQNDEDIVHPAIILLAKIYSLWGYNSSVQEHLTTAMDVLSNKNTVGSCLLEISLSVYQNVADRNSSSLNIAILSLILDLCELSEDLLTQLSSSRFNSFFIKRLSKMIPCLGSDSGILEELYLGRIICKILPSTNFNLKESFHSLLFQLLKSVQMSCKEANFEDSIAKSIQVVRLLNLAYRVSPDICKYAVSDIAVLSKEECAKLYALEGNKKIPLPANRSALEFFKFILFLLPGRKPISLDLFRNIVSLMIDSISSEQVRLYLIKSNFLIDLIMMVQRFVKAKEYARVEAAVFFLLQLTRHADSHTALVHLDGFVSDLIFLADVKNNLMMPIHTFAMLCIRNLALSKENKVYFLNEENFMVMLRNALISQTASVDLFASVTSLLRMMQYDNQKAKALFKNHDIQPLCSLLKERLVESVQNNRFGLLKEKQPLFEESLQNIDLLQ